MGNSDYFCLFLNTAVRDFILNIKNPPIFVGWKLRFLLFSGTLPVQIFLDQPVQYETLAVSRLQIVAQGQAV